MKSPEEVKLEFTREWVRKAEGDFNAAMHLFEGGESYLFQTAFHAQQSAEKYLKAFWFGIRSSFRRHTTLES